MYDCSNRVPACLEYHELISVLRDIDRFVLYFKGAIEQLPLQIYASGLLFSPRTSLARQAFKQYTLETSWLNLPSQKTGMLVSRHSKAKHLQFPISPSLAMANG